MKTPLLIFTLLLIICFCDAQEVIRSDTSILKTIGVNESFELRFEDLPGAGYMWRLSENSDTTWVKIELVKKELMEGYQPIGGKYISIYAYTGLSTGTFMLEYYYGRPWLKEKLYKCTLKIIAE